MYPFLANINEMLGHDPKVLEYIRYSNEFETMQKIVAMNLSQKGFWAVYAEDKYNMSSMRKESERFRAEGHKLFMAKDNTRDVLGACNLYTKAIFAAPHDSQQLAFAHADRAIALLEYGYVQQAYDDCVCALEYKYPENLQHKIIMTQAKCARQLGDKVLFRKHLNTLGNMSLDECYRQQAVQLHEPLNNLSVEEGAQTEAAADHTLHRDSQNIVHSRASIGSYMVASREIQPNELIYREKAFCIVPEDEHRICQGCTATLLIPIPCMRCHGRVVYCSWKCRIQHDAIHSLECAAYRRKLLPTMGFSELQLAFRMVITGLPQVVGMLKDKTSASAIWEALVQRNGIVQSSSVEYAPSLRMLSTLDTHCEKNIFAAAMQFHFLTMYLKKFTTFFKLADDTAASQSDWELVAGSLMLRHFGQTKAIKSYSSVVSLQIPIMDPLVLLRDSFWAGPYRVQRGHLHFFSGTHNVAVANVPYMSFHSHACVPSFHTKFSGGFISTLAVQKIETGEKIYTCYTSDHLNSMSTHRREWLQRVFHLDCKCVKCTSNDPDTDFAQFHQYRCEQCRQVYTNLPVDSSLSWWVNADYDKFKCTVCGAEQTCEWYHHFCKLLDSGYEPSMRRNMIFKKFEALDNWLVGYNEVKVFLASLMITHCFEIHFDGLDLQDPEFEKLGKIAEFLLKGTAAQDGEKSLPYAGRMTYLWDLIAFGKYQCTHEEMQRMLPPKTPNTKFHTISIKI